MVFTKVDDLKRLVQKSWLMENLEGPKKNMNGLKLYLEDDYDNLLKQL